MEASLENQIRNYVEEHAPEAERLLKELAVIPAPSGKEHRRATYCKQWLESHGATDVYIDEAGNVIYPYEAKHRNQLAVYMAHMDVVFPDEDQLIIHQRNRLLVGPGVGDDTANLVNLLMAAAFFATKKPALQTGILFVADTCEEGLGNLKGCKQIMKDYAGRIDHVISFDLYLGQCFCECVGSLRYEVNVETAGGHSFSDFGSPSAIQQSANLICTLYQQEVPTQAATTYNVGTIEGGTSINTIAQSAKFLYEIRSVDSACMEDMNKKFYQILSDSSKDSMNLNVQQIGERPCAKNVNPSKWQELLKTTASAILHCTQKPADMLAASTDANIPLSMGIPALTLGTIHGGRAHTREEWIDLDSQRTGMYLVLYLIFELAKQKGTGEQKNDFFS
jgi:acetylornithine deacetylase/succinyl-diaminopimelate desuccinylase-like protein